MFPVLVAVLVSAPALAQRDPAACTQTGVAIRVEVFRADGTTGVVGSVAPCLSMNYRVTLAKALDVSSICAFEGGTLTLRTPDGIVHTITANVPCIGGDGIAPGCSPSVDFIQSALIPYTVSPSDAVGGLLTASAMYVGGVVHDAATPTPGVSATTPRTTPLAGTSCADLNRCTIDLCDSQLGCVHLPSKRCLLGQPFKFGVTKERGTMTFKRQSGTGDAGDFLKVTLQEAVLVSENGEVEKRKLKVSAILSGPDAAVASLLYPVATLGGVEALAALQARGYDFSIIGTYEPCSEKLPAETCTALAAQLAQAMDAQLALGDEVERDAFRAGARALGYLTDQCCVTTTCEASNANCGSLPDGCGGTLQCGTCTLPLSCGGGGEPNRCGIIL
jgi:hypothetical protein